MYRESGWFCVLLLPLFGYYFLFLFFAPFFSSFAASRARFFASTASFHWRMSSGMGRGGTVEVEGIRCTLVQAFHSSSIKDGNQVIYGGEPGGFVIQFENGFTIYHAGDTNVFGDMKIIADLYAPELVMLPIGDLYTMSPREAAYACRLLNPKWVIPIHYATFPPLTGRPEQLRDLTKDLKLEVVALKPGETLT